MSQWGQISGLILIKGFFDLQKINKNSPIGTEGGLSIDVSSNIVNNVKILHHVNHKTYINSDIMTTISFTGLLRDFEVEHITRIEKWLNGITVYFNKLEIERKDDIYFNDGIDYLPERLTTELVDVNIRFYSENRLFHFYVDSKYENDITIYEIYKREMI